MYSDSEPATYTETESNLFWLVPLSRRAFVSLAVPHSLPESLKAGCVSSVKYFSSLH